MSTSRTYPVEARYDLTPEEIEQVGADMATLVDRLETVTEEKKVTAKAFQTDIEEAKNTLSEKAKIRRQGWENRMYDCHLQKDPEKEERVWVDVNTGEEVKRTRFLPEDYQRELPLDGKAPDTMPDDMGEEEPPPTPDDDD